MKKNRISFFQPSVPKKALNLDWEQSKARFPLMNPYGDIDRDGVKNYKDCKPFNIKRQGKKHDEEEIAVGFDTIKGLKTVRDVQRLEESILRRGEEDE